MQGEKNDAIDAFRLAEKLRSGRMWKDEEVYYPATLIKSQSGLDVHAASSTFAVVSESGKRLRSFPVETNGRALVEAIRLIPGRRHVVLEEGTQSAWLYETLAPHVEEIDSVASVVPPVVGGRLNSNLRIPDGFGRHHAFLCVDCWIKERSPVASHPRWLTDATPQ